MRNQDAERIPLLVETVEVGVVNAQINVRKAWEDVGDEQKWATAT